MGLYNPGQATTDKSAFAWLDGSTTAFRSWAVGAPDNKDSKEGKCVAVAATAETICSQCCCDYNFLCWCSSGCGYRLNTPPCGFGCEGCVTNNIYSWNDVGCDTKMGAICKLPASAALTACGATPGTTSPSSASCDACCSSNKAGTLFKKVARTGGKCVAAKLE